MKKTLLFTIFLFSSITLLLAQQNDVEKEKELIKNVIQSAYIDGLCNNFELDSIHEGIHPGFVLFGSGQGNILRKTTIHNWIEYAKMGKAKGNKYTFQNEFTTIKYQFIDVTGKAAVAKIDFYEGEELKFVDYLSLLKFESGWRIISKTYHALPQEK
ncbi:nuclear transport factor 2 family protein [Labilibaculum sp. DW002]|uniref:Nuclear transport factor 2 family protein n=1 Tax=Paralabilibaculum antarcticum TaxID=2912572 RepID=A0ABT5VSI9_9BACT|nr:nuclear transport factor 2 family protein [Labilibaculum sp. DW002]MDE5418389.1 nuclear transport factor 2 family protein [Labilibaculum sp. DW002]